MRATRAERKESFTRGYVAGVIASSWAFIVVVGIGIIAIEVVQRDLVATMMTIFVWSVAHLLLIYSSRHLLIRFIKWIAKPRRSK